MKLRRTPFWDIFTYGVFGLLALMTLATFIAYLPGYYQTQLAFGRTLSNQGLLGFMDPIAYVLITAGRDVFVTFMFWVVTLNLTWRNWQKPNLTFFSALLFLAGPSFSGILLTNIDNQRLTAMGQWIHSLSQISFVSLLFVFPHRKTHPDWLQIPLVSWPILTYIFVIGSLFIPGILRPDFVEQAQTILLFVFLIAGGISLLLRYKHISNPVEKQQIRWLVTAFAIVLSSALIVWVSNLLIQQFLPDAQAALIYNLGLITVFSTPAGIIFPILVGMAISRLYLWELDIALNRVLETLFYAAILFAFGILVWVLIQIPANILFGIESNLGTILSLLLVCLFAVPLYQFSRGKIARWYPSRQIYYNQALEKFSHEARLLFDETEISGQLNEAINEVIEIRFCDTYRFDPTGGFTFIQTLRQDRGSTLLDLHKGLKQVLEQGYYYPGLGSSKLLVALENEHIPGSNHLMGALVLGPKASGRGYTREEIKFLQSLGSEAAMALYISKAQNQTTLLATALESAANSIALVNADGTIDWVNRAFYTLTGYELEELLGKPYSMASDVLKEEGNSAWRIVTNKKTWTGIGESKRKDGSVYTEELTMTPVIDESNQISHIVVIKNDITERVEIQEKLEHQATHDALTNLPNRLLFNDRLTQTLASSVRTGQRGAVLYIDLDDFKSINDIYTHELGDLLLINLAERMQKAIRASDTVARLGGDEFAMLVAEIERPSDAGMFGERMINLIHEPLVINGIHLQISGSIGISIFPDDAKTASELLRYADIAMYRAKNAGKGQIAYFTEAMSREVKQNLEIRNLLQTAVKDQRLRLVFQPQLNLSTSQLRGFEALLRLEHPKDGILEPVSFLEQAEKSGLIVELEDWVLDQGLMVGAQLLNQLKAPLKIAINISSPQLFSDRFLMKLTDALSKNNFPAENLDIEFKESFVTQNIEGAREIMQEVKRLGVCLAIDDFGTANSSFNHLAFLPIDVMKINQDFIFENGNNLEHEAVFDGIVTIARKLEIDIIAEGVETADQLQYLTDRGVTLVQGFYFSKPITEADLLEAKFGESRD